jgi:cyclic beta-1,2-glucan synthetase
MQGLGLMRAMAQSLSLWSWGRVQCDLVVVNSEPSSYFMAFQRELMALRDRHMADISVSGADAISGFFVLHMDELPGDALSTLRAHASVRIDADGRPLAHHVAEWLEVHERAAEERHETHSTPVPMRVPPFAAAVSVPAGIFSAATGEFQFRVGSTERPTRPWINVLSNPRFGAQVSETGAGYTWALNSRMNQLTAWSNDPVADPPSEWFLLQDLKSQEIWSIAPCAWGLADTAYQIAHGQGYTTIRHRHGDLEVTATWCVDSKTSVKQVEIVLVNHGRATRRLRLVGLMEWQMGGSRSDRNTVRTTHFCQRLPDQKLTALLSTQRECSAGFGEGTAFFGIASSAQEEDWTCDRRECFDARGRLVLPDHFGRRSGDGLDPCAALSSRCTLESGETTTRIFLVGYADSANAARQLATQAASTAVGSRMQEVRSSWDQLLDATVVATPDPLFDAMVNRWLLYQTVTCRLWAKAGFYQAGGATGFRDQLQDAMAMAWAAPDMLRNQIILCASRQFPEGDVQHWWHAPTGAGVRTHFSDDLLWLAYACSHYLKATGDAMLLEQMVPFIEGIPVPEASEDAYYTPAVSESQASVYEHAARAIDRSLRVGEHGLPLMGTGDWNDGMNQVGNLGRGESVWLGWFLCELIADFAPLAYAHNQSERGLRWEEAAKALKVSLHGEAWDGQWYKRAFFDEGQALGSQVNPEARIDLIAQAWSVLSGVAPADRQRMALAAVERNLVDPDACLIKLLDPPLVHAVPSAGYIQAYPPGVRENGGQYTHAGVWALMAVAKFATTHAQVGSDSDAAYRYFTYLSPAHRTQKPDIGAVYGIEPYVMAGDVYTHAPYVGRGGWSWYTGAAAWMHRAAIESIFGLEQGAQTLIFRPCLPSHWFKAEMTMVRDARRLHFILIRANTEEALRATAAQNAQPLLPGAGLSWRALPEQSCFVIPLLGD